MAFFVSPPTPERRMDGCWGYPRDDRGALPVDDSECVGVGVWVRV